MTSVYLICTRRKNRPRIALDVCKACKRNGTCRQFERYRNPPLFPELGKPQGNAIS